MLRVERRRPTAPRAFRAGWRRGSTRSRGAGTDRGDRSPRPPGVARAAGAGRDESAGCSSLATSRAAAVPRPRSRLRVVDLRAARAPGGRGHPGEGTGARRGPLGRVTSLVYRASGRETASPIRTVPVAVARSRRAGAGRRGDPRSALRTDPDGASRHSARACGNAGSQRRESSVWNGRSIGRSAAWARSSRRPAAGGPCSGSSRRSRRRRSRYRPPGSSSGSSFDR